MGVQTLSAIPQPYNRVALSWDEPDGFWSAQKLIRSPYNLPADVNDGTVLLNEATGSLAFTGGLLGGPRTPVTTSFVDTSVPGGWQYYSLFARTLTDSRNFYWRRVADVTVLSVTDRGATGNLLNRIPRWFTNESEMAGAPNIAPAGVSDPEHPYGGYSPSSAPIARFLSTVGYEAQVLRGFSDSLLLSSDAAECPGSLLPPLLQQYGYSYEPGIGMRQNRALAGVATRISKYKGTITSVLDLTEAVTGWNITRTPWVNMLLTPTGGWSSTAISAPTVLSLTGNALPFNHFVEFTGASSSPTVLTLSNDPRSASSIPLDNGASTTYTFTFYVLNHGVVLPVAFHWYHLDGSLISTSSGTPALLETVGTTVRYSITSTAPAGAVSVGLSLSWTSTPGAGLAIGGVQLEHGSLPSDYQLPRQLNLAYDPDRLNLIPNPDGADVSSWSTNDPTASGLVSPLAEVHPDYEIVNDYGDASIRVTPHTAGNNSLTTSFLIPATTGLVPFHLSFWAVADLKLVTVVPRLTWIRDSDSTVLRTDTEPTFNINTMGSNPPGYGTVSWGFYDYGTYDSAAFQHGQRHTLTVATPPTGATRLRLSLDLSFPSGSGDDGYGSGFGYGHDDYGAWTSAYFDDFIAEFSTLPGDYFDERFNPGDVITDMSSRLVLFPGQTAKLSRLGQLLPDILPLACAYSLTPSDQVHIGGSSSTDGLYSDIYSDTY